MAPDMREIILTNGAAALVDDEDFDLLSSYRWSQLPHGYVKAHHRSRRDDGRMVDKGLYMHRLILGLSDAGRDVQVDHVNRNRLDNQRANLRRCTFQLNQANRPKQRTSNPSSAFKGVTWGGKSWQCKIGLHSTFLGAYDSESDAARAFDAAARTAYGEFALLNFPNEPSLSAEELRARARPGRGKYPRKTA